MMSFDTNRKRQRGKRVDRRCEETSREYKIQNGKEGVLLKEHGSYK
jgi:hypothetical protein